MKIRSMLTLTLAVLLGSAALSHADVRFRLSVRDDWHDHDWDHPRHNPYYYLPYYRHPWVRPYRPVYVAPVVVTQPVYVPAPVVEQPVPAAPLTGDYGTDLANLNQKLYRLRAVLARQDQKGQITPDQYNRFMNTLDGIEHDEHARAYDRGGNLTAGDFADLYRRANQAGEDIEIALAQ